MLKIFLQNILLAIYSFIKILNIDVANILIRLFSWTMIASWFIGDFVKTILFIQRGAPMQFTLCGIVQLTVDILICYQIYAYTKPKNRFD